VKTHGSLPILLGDLERAVMDRLWKAGPSDAKAVHRAIGKARQITLNTVQSTLERLHRKGLLGREKVSHAYVYTAQLSRAEFGARAMEQFVRDLHGGKLESVLAAFVDLTARTGSEELSKLERLVAERRAERGRRSDG
jgi:predicted transcriptional regulator